MDNTLTDNYNLKDNINGDSEALSPGKHSEAAWQVC